LDRTAQAEAKRCASGKAWLYRLSVDAEVVLGDFYDEEVARAGGYQTSAQVLALHQAKRTHEYLVLILRDYRAASAALLEHLETEQEIPGPLGWTAERRRHVDESERLQTVVHLRIETFYVFAKIMLDKLARAIEIHFGPARGIPLNKHSRLVMKLRDYAAAKGLAVPSNHLVEVAEKVENEIAAFRDRHITHEWNPRRRWATGINEGTGDTSLAAWIVSPKASDSPPLPGLAPPKLMETLDSYVIEVVEYLKANAHHRTPSTA
jgi:hypothetical protein